MSFLPIIDSSIPSPPLDFDLTSPHIVAAVMSNLYKNLLSCVWTADRYYDFLNFATTSLVTTQIKDIRVVINSLIYVKKYLSKVKETNQNNYQQFTMELSENVLFITSFKLSQKFYNDYHFWRFEIDLSIFTNLNSIDLKQFEFKFLDMIDYDLNMKPDEYLQWESDCYLTYTVFITPDVPVSYATYDFQQDYWWCHYSSLEVDQLSSPQEQQQQYPNILDHYYTTNHSKLVINDAFNTTTSDPLLSPPLSVPSLPNNDDCNSNNEKTIDISYAPSKSFHFITTAGGIVNDYYLMDCGNYIEF